GQRTARTVGSLDGPDPVRPLLHITHQRGITGLVGPEPPRPQQLLTTVDDLDRDRHLVGIDPDDHVLHGTTPALLEPVKGTARWAVLLRAGQTPLEPHLVTVAGGSQS